MRSFKLVFCIFLLIGLISCTEITFKMNPKGITPLSAVFYTNKTNHIPVTIVVQGRKGSGDISYTYPAEYGTEFAIHGLYAESDNTIEIYLDKQKVFATNFTIGNISSKDLTFESVYKVTVDLLKNNPRDLNQDIYFLDLSCALIGVDKKGNLRYVNLQTSIVEKIVPSQQEMLIYDKYGIQNLLGIYTLYLSDKKAGHHDKVRKGNNFIVLSKSIFGSEDRVIEITTNGTIIRDLNFGTLIRDIIYKESNENEIALMNQLVFDSKNIYMNSGKKCAIDWAHANSLVYDSKTDILYFSLRHHGVWAVKYKEWKLIWWMADEQLNTKTGTKYGQIPYPVFLKDFPSLESYRVRGGAINSGPKNQHALLLFKNGNIGMFDNQGDDDVNEKGSRYVEYKIENKVGTWFATVIDEYRDPKLYSRTVSDVDLTADKKNLIMLWGNNFKLREIQKNSKRILYELDLKSSNKGYHYYRVEKMPFYPRDNKIYNIDSQE